MESTKKIRRKWLSRMMMLAVIFIGSSHTYPQSFGKNKVQYKDFKWNFLQSQHFDVYYYDDGKVLAEFTADVAESSYVSLKEDFRSSIQKRIPIIVYNSHNDFEQTNVIPYLLTEGLEGFTEYFKDRVVLQFRGSYSDFHHLIHHELTHAVMFQMLYGGGVGAVAGMARFRLPDWINEGFAEYESIGGWDIESDMFMRDATVNGYIPPISMLYGWFNYKGGQSILNYIAEKYGKPKIREMISKIRAHRNLEEGLKKSIGIGEEDLSKDWHKYLRKMYWPDIEDRDEPEDVGKRLTDHVKDKHSLNGSPTLSPKGDKLVYISNRSDYIDVYLMSTVDGKNLGKLVKGERSELFEELHGLRPGMGWSPAGDRITFAAKAGAQDALYILDVKKKDVIDSFRFDMDGVFSPNWSPDGDRIAFMGIDGGQSDIYIYQLSSQKLTRLTNDIFSDLDPVWSPTGDEIAFVSDRGNYTSGSYSDINMLEHDFHQTDLYTIGVETKEIARHTADEAEEMSPAYSPDGNKIAFISDESGIDNIFIMDKSTGESHPITNLLTGVSRISWSREGSRLVFSSFYNGGSDIYMINNPLEIKSGSVKLRKTSFLVKQEKEEEDRLAEAMREEDPEPMGTMNYRNFVFGDAFRKGNVDTVANVKKEKEFLDDDEIKNAEGEYKTKKYKIRFTPDYVTGAAGYNQFFGLQGTSALVLSDILGNHQISIYTDLFYNLKNSNFLFAYAYLPKRTDIGASIFHYSYLWYTYYSDGVYYYPGYIQDRTYGLTFFLSRPFSRYQRIDFSVTGLGIDRNYGEIDYWGYTGDFIQELGSLYKRRILSMNLGYSTDTVLWGMTGPVNGGRSSFRVSYSPLISKKYGLDFWTVRGDWRKYFRIKRDYSFSIRFSGGGSGGKNPQRFLLGGMRGWMNYQYHEISTEEWGDDLFYFSSFETPLRGSAYYEHIGTRFLLANLEFRFPLIRYLILGWPLPLGFQNIRGVVFLDVGSAWYDDEKWQPLASEPRGLIQLNGEQASAGFGFGTRLNLGFFLLKYDVAWNTDFSITADKPMHYFTFGAEF